MSEGKSEKKEEIKVVHITSCSYLPGGIPNLPFLIPLNLEKYKKSNFRNIVILTKSFYKPKNVRLNFPIFLIRSKFKLLYFILKNKPEVIIIYVMFGSLLSLLIMILSKILRIKVISFPDFAEYGIPKLHKSLWKTIVDVFRYLLMLPQFTLSDKIVVATRHEIGTLSRIKKVDREKYSIIPYGHDIDIGTERKEKYIFTASRWWRDRKNLHTIIKVFSKVLTEKPGYKLYIAGDFLKGEDWEVLACEGRRETGEDYKKKIVKLIKKFGLERDVDFLGIKVGRELESLFKRAKIFYLPSKYETFGTVYIQSMASGTPIVAMKNSAVQYVVKDGVTGFLRNDEEGQKEAILRLLTDEKLYKEMQKNCLKEAEKYKWENVIKKWESLIEELIK